uniref:Uncharacterized protein n=1 Tax=Trypanosoma congolense (strain IL3000) TaxID=1068625 RepID=G0UQQ1_TRYCI|nr:hypothetical protein, unlikely [Trypanosoma congolense IL3000]
MTKPPLCFLERGLGAMPRVFPLEISLCRLRESLRFEESIERMKDVCIEVKEKPIISSKLPPSLSLFPPLTEGKRKRAEVVSEERKKERKKIKHVLMLRSNSM